MQQALTSVIDQLILECDDERVRLKEKKLMLEGVRSALFSAESSSTEPPAKKAKKGKDNAAATAPAPVDADAGKKRKKKEKTDPNKPKRAASAYTLFFMEYAKKYKADHPEVAQKDIMSIVGPVWKEMDAKKKAPYEARATVLRAEHAEAMSVYTGVPAASSSSASSAAAIAAPAPVRKDSVSSSGSSSSSSSSDSD